MIFLAFFSPLLQTQLAHDLPGFLLAPALLALVFSSDGGGVTCTLITSSSSLSLLQLRDGVSITVVAVAAGLDLLLLGGHLLNISHLWFLLRSVIKLESL